MIYTRWGSHWKQSHFVSRSSTWWCKAMHTNQLTRPDAKWLILPHKKYSWSVPTQFLTHVDRTGTGSREVVFQVRQRPTCTNTLARSVPAATAAEALALLLKSPHNRAKKGNQRIGNKVMGAKFNIVANKLLEKTKRVYENKFAGCNVCGGC